MDARRENSVDEVIGSLIAYDPIKVWSWLTTIFGDMAREPESELSGSVLGVLTEAVGIRPQAMRVAIHRLRKDGWIVARKEGRTSHYRLTDAALAETIAASHRIYAAEVAVPTHWHLMITGPADDGDAPFAGYLKIADACYLGSGPRRSDHGTALALDVSRDALPEWVMRAAVPDDLSAMYARFSSALSMVEGIAGSLPDMTLLQRTTLRLLVLHHWRRTVLRGAPSVDALGGRDWIGGSCRARSAKIFAMLPAVSPDTIVAAAGRAA